MQLFIEHRSHLFAFRVAYNSFILGEGVHEAMCVWVIVRCERSSTTEEAVINQETRSLAQKCFCLGMFLQKNLIILLQKKKKKQEY